MATDKLVDFDHVTDYISRDEFAKYLADIQYGEAPTGRTGENIDYQNGVYAGLDMAYVALKQFPAADVRPVVRKPVVGYEGLYFVSNDGEVTNADGLVMKQYIKKGHGTCYKSVSLYKDGTYKTKYVHRLVAEAFIPNQNNLPIINHKDEDGTNNRVENLEWCTHRYNVNYGTARERQRKKLVGVPHTEEHKKKISNSLYQHYDEGFEGRRVICLETGVVYDSVAKAARDLGISEAAIRMSCNRGSKKGYKYTFRDANRKTIFCPNCGCAMENEK